MSSPSPSPNPNAAQVVLDLTDLLETRMANAIKDYLTTCAAGDVDEVDAYAALLSTALWAAASVAANTPLPTARIVGLFAEMIDDRRVMLRSKKEAAS